MCLYALTPAFYYIPDAILSAIIIHAVADLVSGPKFLRQLFQVNPFELFTFIAAVLITFFTSVEYGIYVSVGMSIIAMLLRIARPRYAVLGRIPVQRSANYYDSDDLDEKKDRADIDPENNASLSSDSNMHYIYVKQDHQTLSHLVESPPEGVVIFRFDESLTYPNAGFISDKIMHYIQDNFNSSSPPPTSKGQRTWNDRRPLAKPQVVRDGHDDDHASTAKTELQMPKLQAIVLDCSAINHLDSTGVQTLLDLKLSINRYAGYEVEWHFASIGSPAIRNALITSGFGVQAGRGPRTGELLPVVPVHRDGPQCDLNSSPPNDTEVDLSIAKPPTTHVEDLEQQQYPSSVSNCSRTSYVVNVDGQGQVEYYPRLDRGLPIDRYPFFHWDLEDAVRAASYTHRKESSI